ncbi:unnamed protein product [Caenorhabditis sp. 36 PRJEB53466]|nr:unnamed protein product [Caenorhabditis sp. 36 PRJEB53466]
MAWCRPQIEFEKEIYFPGEEVTGRAWVATTKDMTARSVIITFSGKSVSSWPSDGKFRPVETPYTGVRSEQVHVKMEHEVWSPTDENNVFPAGEYEWAFQFELPKECPPSFEGKYGFIRYSVHVNIDVPKWVDTQAERAVTVSPTIDLNSIPGAGEPVELHAEQSAQILCGCLPIRPSFLKRGSVLFTVNSPTLGYVSGQTISVSGLVENKTTKPLKAISATLSRVATYRQQLETNAVIISALRSGVRTEKWDIEDKTERVQVASGLSHDFKFSFEIPPVVATIRSSKYVGLEYFVKITAEVDSWCMDTSSVQFNFILGNVPLLVPGSTSLPPHTFEKGDKAVSWAIHLKPEYVTQFPYYGSEAKMEQSD